MLQRCRSEPQLCRAGLADEIVADSLQAGLDHLLRPVRGGASREPRCRDTASVGWSHGSPRSRRDPPPAGAHAGRPSSCRSATAACCVSPFAFFRGAAAIMAADLADTPVSGPRAQLCGDAHLANFGVFAAPDRGWSSTSTTSTRRCPGPGNGTSSAWPRASRSPAATAASAAARAATRPRARRAPTARRCASFAAMRTDRRLVRPPRRRGAVAAVPEREPSARR